MSCVLCGEFCIMSCELPVMSFELYRRTHINYINTCSYMHFLFFGGQIFFLIVYVFSLLSFFLCVSFSEYNYLSIYLFTLSFVEMSMI